MSSVISTQCDLLQFAIKACSTGSCVVNEGAFVSVFRHLIFLGAHIDSIDEDGKTPLYYACTAGNVSVFSILIEVGADLWRKYEFVGCANLESRINPISMVDLLQLTADSRLAAEYGRPVSYLWQTPSDESWGTILVSLFDRGLPLESKDPSITKFLQVACIQGKYDYVKEMVKGMLEANGPLGDKGNTDPEGCESLNATDIGFQSSNAQILLNTPKSTLSIGHIIPDSIEYLWRL